MIPSVLDSSILAALSAYIPEDRRQALAQGTELPVQSYGAVLFADISGFTPLTEALVLEMGPRRGAEELTRRLNHVYGALVAEVRDFGGSVINFSGDAITCWFGEDDGTRAATCAVQMQRAMGSLATIQTPAGLKVALAIKVAVSTGPVHRFLVGNPTIQVVEVLAGAPLDEVAAAEKAAGQGEILLTAPVVKKLGNWVQVADWRSDGAGQPVALLGELLQSAVPAPWPALAPEVLSEATARPWLLPAVYERLRHGHGQFLAELRTTAILFLKFGGLAWDEDPEVGQKLNAYISWVQEIAAYYEGTLLQLTTGDKGSYLLVGFGAPAMHEDDADRAILAALMLRDTPARLNFIYQVQIGLSFGRVRAGAYGGGTRLVYGTMGDEINVAARLMSQAQQGQILATSAILQAAHGTYHTEALGQVALKGKQKVIPLFAIVAQAAAGDAVPARPAQAALLGRRQEQEQLAQQLQRLQAHGAGGVVILEGEAGIGKTRLALDLLDKAQSLEVAAHLIAGNAIEKNTAYHPWTPLFRILLGLENTVPPKNGALQVTAWLAAREPDLADRASLLNGILALDFPENALTGAMAGQARANSTNQLLARILALATGEAPLVLVVEDAHWLDSASWSLVQEVRQTVDSLLLVIATRPMAATEEEMTPVEYRRLAADDRTVHLLLTMLPAPETLALVEQRLGITSLPEPVGRLILHKSEGHPFFAEEIAYALRDAGWIIVENGRCRLAPQMQDLSTVDFPDTIQGVITSRIDRLATPQQLALKVASVIGRSFALLILQEVYPVAVDRPELPVHLDRLQQLDITRLERMVPELAYIFKHIITQEVAYQLMTSRQRRDLHQSVANWYEHTYHQELATHYPLLAHHWSLAEDAEKAITFLSLAAEQALQNYANQEAVNFLQRAIAVTGSKDVPSSNSHHATWQEQLGEAYFRLGRLPESEAHLRRTLALLGQPVPEHPLRLVRRLLGQIGRQLWRRLWPIQARPDAPAGPEDEEARLRQLYRTYERFTELVFLNNDVGLILYGTLHSLNVAEALGPSAELAHAYAQMCVTIGVIPIHSLARLYRRLANETVQRLEDPAAKVDVQWLTAVYAAGIGAWEEAEAKLAQAIEFFEKTANWKQWGLSLEVTSRVIYNRGQFTRLQEIADRLATVAFRTDDLLQQTWVYLNRLEYALFAEPEATDSLALMEEALARVAQTREVGTIMMSQALLSVIQARAGAWEAAAAAAEQGLSVILSAKTASFGMYVAYANTTATYLALWERQPGASAFQQSAKEACRAITGYARAFTFVQPRSLLYQGLLAWLEGRENKAHKVWRHSLARAADLQMPYEQGLVHYEIGRHLALGDPARGQHLSQARYFFAGLHAHYDLRRVEAIMQQESGL